MEPLLKDGNLEFYHAGQKNPDRGEVILFKKDGTIYVKRVYGLPGDTVTITEQGMVLVNEKPLVISGLKVLGETKPEETANPVTLGEEEYFVLGDHRSLSKDSRSEEVGLVHQEEIMGVLFRK